MFGGPRPFGCGISPLLFEAGIRSKQEHLKVTSKGYRGEQWTHIRQDVLRSASQLVREEGIDAPGLARVMIDLATSRGDEESRATWEAIRNASIELLAESSRVRVLQ